MNIERKENTNENKELTKKDLGLLAGVVLVASAAFVAIAECTSPVPGCEEKKTPQEVQHCRDHNQYFPPSGQHMW